MGGLCHGCNYEALCTQNTPLPDCGARITLAAPFQLTRSVLIQHDPMQFFGLDFG
jgi:hypothetical protein